jgi:hypothetical protein
MIGLFFSEAILFVVAALIGFAVGWRAFATLAARRARDDAQEVERLRTALSNAHVRRARGA